MAANSPAPECERCGDARRVRVTDDINAADFGRTYPCPACVLNVREDEEMFALRAHIDPLYRRCRLDNYRPPTSGYRAAVARYVAEWRSNPKPFLLLRGPAGTGKTHLAVAALFALHEATGLVGRFVSTIDLLDRFKASYDQDAAQTAAQIEAELDRYPLLVLDEFGAHQGTEWTHDRLYKMVDQRYRELRPTIFTMNVGLDVLAPRLAERLDDGRVSTVITFQGKSQRTGR